jgi:polysaccharide export outer membrane protein
MRVAWVLLLLVLCGPAVADDYRLGPGDLLRVNVFGYPDMTADVRVDDAGSITYAFVGSVPVSGKTVRELEIMLARSLAEGGFIRGPQVSVLVVEYRSQRVAVMGQVTRPGQYPLRKTSTVLDMLAEAGGLVTGIAADRATLLRADGSKQPIDLYALFEGDMEQNVTVFAGDTLYVPRAPQFYIYGEVQRPGAYRLERNMTVSQAISAGGGLTARGTERRAVVKRKDAKGKERHISVRGSDLLQPDDVLVVKESIF